MRKIIFIFLITISLILFSACSKNYNTPNEVENPEYTTETNYTVESCDCNGNSSAIISGVCSIGGAACGAFITLIITNLIEKKKQRKSYLTCYHKLLHESQNRLEKIDQNNFNFEELEYFINDLISRFETSNDLYLYVGQLYYAKGYEKFKESLKALKDTVLKSNYSSEKSLNSIRDILINEENKIKKLLK